MIHAGGTQLLLDSCIMSSAFWTGDQGICAWDRHSPIDLLRCSTNGGTAKGNFLLLAGFEDHVLSLGTVCLVAVTGGQKVVPWCWDRKACSLLGVISPKHRLSSLRSSVTQSSVGFLGPEPWRLWPWSESRCICVPCLCTC